MKLPTIPPLAIIDRKREEYKRIIEHIDSALVELSAASDAEREFREANFDLFHGQFRCSPFMRYNGVGNAFCDAIDPDLWRDDARMGGWLPDSK
jgi:hypothetical protein